MVRIMSKQLVINGELLLLCERMEMAKFLQVYLQYLFRQGLSLPQVQLLNYRSMEQLEELAERLPRIPGSNQVRRVGIFADAQEDLENRNNVILDVRSSAFFGSREYCAHFFFPGRKPGRRWLNGYLEDLLLATLKADVGESNAVHNQLNMAREYLVSVEQLRKIVREQAAFEQVLAKNCAVSNDAAEAAKGKSFSNSICEPRIEFAKADVKAAAKESELSSRSNSFLTSNYKLTNPSRHLLYAYFAGTEKFVGCSLAEAAKLGAFDFENARFAELKKCLLGLGK